MLNKRNPECCFHCINRSKNGGTDGTCPAQPGKAELGTKSAHPDAVTLLGLGGNVNLLPLTLSFLHFSALNHAAAVAAAHAGAQPGSKPASSETKRFWGVEGSAVMDKRICAFEQRARLSLLFLPCGGFQRAGDKPWCPGSQQHKLMMEWKLSMASEQTPALYKRRGLKCGLVSRRNENKTSE